MRTRTLRSWETRRYSVWFTADADPTGDTVEFATVAVGSPEDPTADPAGWTAGAWQGTYNAATGRVEAYTPTYGTSDSTVSPDVTLTEGTSYFLYGRSRNATDAPGDLVAVLEVT